MSHLVVKGLKVNYGGIHALKGVDIEVRDGVYATIRGFVLKFEELHLLMEQKYGNRVKYRVNV